jgi:transposase
MGTRRQREKQEDIWVAHTELASAPGHPFYQRLNELLEAEGFDEFVEGRCAKFYAARYGRPSLTPGIYFRSLLIGYFEGIDSERGIAWRLADSLALRRFVGIGLDEYTPDHSTISRTRRLIDLDTHGAVFGWVLSLLADRGLLKGQRIAIDATTLEANAAMRSIVRRDTGESYEEFLCGLAKASGLETPTREDLARLDRKRKKRMSNKEWKSPADEDARIAKMKDGRTHLAHKAEHAVDLDTGAVVAVTLQGADQGDTTTLDETLCEAGMAVAEQIGREAELRDHQPKVNVNGIEELVTDKGYHSGAVAERVKSYEVRSYIPEKQQAGRRNWQGKQAEQQAVYQNRRRVRGGYGKSLLRRRGELVERSFAHCYETGGMRRTHLRGQENILKRQLVHVGAFNLSLILRQLLGAGTPREWRNRFAKLVLFLYLLFPRRKDSNRLCRSQIPMSRAKSFAGLRSRTRRWPCRKSAINTTGCYTGRHPESKTRDHREGENSVLVRDRFAYRGPSTAAARCASRLRSG